MAFSPEALAAADVAHFDARSLGLAWIAPFAGLLLSIAILPLAAPSLWHHHQGKIAAAWSLAFILPFAALHGPGVAFVEVLHTALIEYVPFLILLFALFTVAGGVHLRGNLHGSPGVNTGLLAIGTGLASFTGTTGASMLLVRPMIRANDARRHNVHVVIFFIFLVANVGGSLTPLGDPPLFLGFLHGVGFFWTMTHMAAPLAVTAAILLALFFMLDTYLYRKEGIEPPLPDPTPDSQLGIGGKINILLLLGVVAAVLASGTFETGATVAILGIEVPAPGLARDAVLLAIAYLSWRYTPQSAREGNGFAWGPIIEVAKLFAGIFVTIIPAIAMLRAGADGALGPVVRLVTAADGSPVNAMYFWLTGGLSALLDNAPTYLVFFNAAGGDAERLMGPLAGTLLAISAGSVFMGAMTYIGNAPNFMVKAIAEESGVRMPGFFGYMLWSVCILTPCFLLLTWLFFL
ncbi:MAG: sodium:proton antiporter [Alphaproteobacteria bacterium]|nr:sodium:proton antiporter [Alphaproteobacteria bacterium]